MKLSLFGLRRKVRRAALQQIALQKQDFRFNPKTGDGNNQKKSTPSKFKVILDLTPKMGTET